jgi:hypothetical protein
MRQSIYPVNPPPPPGIPRAFDTLLYLIPRVGNLTFWTAVRVGHLTPDSSTVPRYILVQENMPVRGLGVDKPNPFPSSNASDWEGVRFDAESQDMGHLTI